MPFSDYRITSPFGWRNHPISGQRSFHTGIDLVKSHRAPIPAFTAGEVLFAGMGQSGSGFGGYGNVVLIKDRNNRGQVYAHLDSVSVKRGQQVSAGQTIGRQGNTGNSTGSHLHYEVRKQAQASPPYGWIADRSNNCIDPTQYLRDFSRSAVSSSGLLQHGSKGKAVYHLQNLLLAAGEKLPRFGADEDFGDETETAVKAFQARRGIKVDGIAGPQTMAELNKVVPTLNRLLRVESPLMRGNDVRAVQRVVGVNDDSLYGNISKGAVERYQRDNGLTVDGVVGQQTWSHMFG